MGETESIATLQQQIYDLIIQQFPEAKAVHLIVRPGAPVDIHVLYGKTWHEVPPSVGVQTEVPEEELTKFREISYVCQGNEILRRYWVCYRCQGSVVTEGEWKDPPRRCPHCRRMGGLKS